MFIIVTTIMVIYMILTLNEYFRIQQKYVIFIKFDNLIVKFLFLF